MFSKIWYVDAFVIHMYTQVCETCFYYVMFLLALANLKHMFLVCVQTEAIKPILGDYYRDPKKSGPIPIHLVEPLLKSLKEDHFVSDTGDVVYYQTDPNF